MNAKLASFRGHRKLVGVAVPILVAVGTITGLVVSSSGPVKLSTVHPVAIRPPAGTQLCNGGSDSSRLMSPYPSAPAGAVTVPAGDDSTTAMSSGGYIDLVYDLAPNTTYWFAPGVHTLGTSQFGQIAPQSGDTFLGAPGAILSGGGVNLSAFDNPPAGYTDTGVTIEYLTIERFVAINGAMVVNHDGGVGWKIKFNTIRGNGGAGVGLGTDDVVTENCLEHNDEYGFQGFAGASNVTLSDNEISGNNTNGTYDQNAYTASYSVTNGVATFNTLATFNTVPGGKVAVCIDSSDPCDNESPLDGTWTVASAPSATRFTFAVNSSNVRNTVDTTGTVSDPPASGNPGYLCGCSGGGKFYGVSGGGVVEDNWVHDNGYVGIWFDDDNAGFTVRGNYINNNWAEGLVYEISYNADIEYNSFVENALGQGQSPGFLNGFPASAVYVSESGSDSRVSGSYGSIFAVEHNQFTDNWGGVILYENSNRACGIAVSSLCTLVDPSKYTLSSCQQNLPNSVLGVNGYADNCRWKTQNVSIEDNRFDLTASAIGRHCSAADDCGFNGLFSETATFPTILYDVSSQTSTNGAASSITTLTVSSTTNFAPGPAELYVPTLSGSSCYQASSNCAVLAYTGISPTTFTGVTLVSGSGTVNSGAAVYPFWPASSTYPYARDTIPNNISNHQNNSFRDNRYCGAWNFMGFTQGNAMTRGNWTSGEANAAASGDRFSGQDARSTFATSGCRSVARRGRSSDGR